MNALRFAAESPLVERLGWALVHSFWEIALVALILALALPMLRRNALAAYAACCAALAMALLLPVLTFALLPGSPVAVASVDRPVFVDVSAASVALVGAEPEASSVGSAPITMALPTERLPATGLPSNDALARSEPTIATSLPAQDSSRQAVRSRWMPWIVGGWWLGVSVLALWNLGGWLAVQRLRSRGMAVSSTIEAAVARIARELGLRRPVVVRQSTLVDAPLVIGALRPMILLPVALVTGIPPEQLETLLAHELAHIRRHDYLINLVQTAIETLLFHHPAVWWISAQVRIQREHCCDDLALRFAPDRAVYVKALAACAGARPQALLPAATGGQLVPRLRRVMGLPESRRARTSGWLASAAILIAGAATFVTYAARSRPVSAEMAAQNPVAGAEKADDKPAPNAEANGPRKVTGILVDRAGFPVALARVDLAENVPGGGVWTDESGRFTLTVSPESKALMAWSQRSGRMTVIPITADMPADRRYLLASSPVYVLGRVVDPDDKLFGGNVIFRVAGPDGWEFTMQRRAPEGTFAGMFPAVPGWTVRAMLPESGEATPAVPLADVHTVDLPDLVRQAPAEPNAKPAPQMAGYSGRVVDEQEMPIAGARLEFMGRSGGRAVSPGGAVTDADGRWSRRMAADLSSLEVRSDHPDFVGAAFALRRSPQSKQAMLDGTAMLVLRRGARIRGTIRDVAGAPIGNALVIAGESYSGFGGISQIAEIVEDASTARTARDGTFSIGGIPPGTRRIVAQASGCAPALVSLEVNQDTKPLDLVLERGRTITGRIVDSLGNPVPDVRIQCRFWVLANSPWREFSRMTSSGADGRFSLIDMPRQGVVPGSVQSTGETMPISFEIVPGADDVGDVPLYPYPVIRGRVVDDETGAPVTRFAAISGYLNEEGILEGGLSPPRGIRAAAESGSVASATGDFQSTGGRTSFTLGDEPQFVVKIAAVGYATAITPPVVPSQGRGTFEVRLRKARPIRGTARLPDGSPAAGANVYVVGVKSFAWIKGIALDDRLPSTPDVRTKAAEDGKFELPSSEARDRLLFLHAAGYAIIPTIGFKPDQQTVLIPWSRIEGTYRPGGRGREGTEIAAEATRPLADWASRDRIQFSLNARTNADGRFVMEHVPAMQLDLGAPHAFSRMDCTVRKLVRTEPGKTQHVTLGDDGPSASGRIDLSGFDSTNSPMEVRYQTNTSRIRAIRIDPAPERPQNAEAADWEEQLRSVVDGTADETLTLPALFAELKRDGSFAFEALSPGKYVLLAGIHGPHGSNTCRLLLGRGHAEFTVGDRPLVLPAVPVHVLAHPQAGNIAPEVAGLTADGRNFLLSNLRGRFVVLNFWAGQFAPSRAWQPAIQALHRRFGAGATFVGLNFDGTDERAKKAIAAMKSPWPQILAGPWNAHNPTLVAYGVDTISSLWLLDRDGKVVAKNLTPEELEQHLERLLAKPGDR